MSLQSHFYVNGDEKRVQTWLSQIEKGVSHNAARQAPCSEEGEQAIFIYTPVFLD